MPLLRCDHCGEEVQERSRLAIDSDCEACGEGTLREVDEWDELDEAAVELKTTVGAGPHIAIARSAARSVLERHGVTRPPAPVEEIAAANGFEVVADVELGQLSGRLIGTRIEIAPCGRHRRRFVVAHELGHHFLKKPHGSGEHVESEVNAFAGELLVPGPFLLAAIAETTVRGQLAHRFDVSNLVLEIAAKNHHVYGRLN